MPIAILIPGNHENTKNDHFHQRWKIEEFHRGIKQTMGIEKYPVQK